MKEGRKMPAQIHPQNNVSVLCGMCRFSSRLWPADLAFYSMTEIEIRAVKISRSTLNWLIFHVELLFLFAFYDVVLFLSSSLYFTTGLQMQHVRGDSDLRLPLDIVLIGPVESHCYDRLRHWLGVTSFYFRRLSQVSRVMLPPVHPIAAARWVMGDR